jgi:hypothetical protein
MAVSALPVVLAALLASAPATGGARVTPCQFFLLDGVARLESGDVDSARQRLRMAYHKDALCTAPDVGLAADWLGRAWLAEGDTTRAFAVWEGALSLLTDATWGRGGDQLVGVYLETLARVGRAASIEAATAFDLLMRPTSGGARGSEAYWRLLAQVASVVPDSVREEAFVSGDWRRGVAPGGDRRLAEWWVSEDPYPATAPSERVAEHLGRVAEALDSYPDPSADRGYDDRGDLLVRFGPPTMAMTLTFEDPTLVFAMSRSAVGISRSSFPSNEVWTYESLGDAMTYILVREGNAFRIGETVDLLPPSLRDVVPNGRRSAERYEIALQAMRYIYDRLATTAVEYGDAWGRVDDVLAGMASPVDNMRSAVLDGQRSLAVLEAERHRAREDQEPPSWSTVYETAETVPFEADAARFLDPDGTTRLDLWWRARPTDPERLSDGGALVGSVVVAPRSLDRTTETVVVQTLTEMQVQGRTRTPPAQTSVLCQRAPCAPAVQLDLHEPGTADGALGDRLLTSVWHVEARPPLRAEGLEMSDIKPLVALYDEPLASPAVAPGTQLALYFEGYGFADPPGGVRVTVEYEVVRRRRGSLLRRTVEIPREGQLRLVRRGVRTSQYLLLSTADWADSDEVDVTVRLRDDRTGATVERTRTFTVASDDV